MSGVVFQVRERARGNVTTPMMLWASVMAVVIFVREASNGPHTGDIWVGVIATVLFGVYLGWRRRGAAVFIAPVVSWLFAWLPLWVAAMIHDGFFKGLFVGLFLVTIGWIGIGLVEFFGLGSRDLPGEDLSGPLQLGRPRRHHLRPRRPLTN
jgi:hypothetical protein